MRDSESAEITHGLHGSANGTVHLGLTGRSARQGDDGDQVDEGEVFAETRTTRLLVALGLPVPDELVR